MVPVRSLVGEPHLNAGPVLVRHTPDPLQVVDPDRARPGKGERSPAQVLRPMGICRYLEVPPCRPTAVIGPLVGLRQPSKPTRPVVGYPCGGPLLAVAALDLLEGPPVRAFSDAAVAVGQVGDEGLIDDGWRTPNKASLIQ